MGPEIFAFAFGTAKVVLGPLLEALADEAAKGSGTYGKSKFKRWQTDAAIKTLYERSKQLRKVKTIWQVEKEVDLLKFYYPSKIKSSTEAPKVVHRLRDFSFDGNLVVRGIVGQGKSTFLRYLAARELALGERLPVFVELRRLTPSQSVVDVVVDEMKNLGLDGASADVVEHLGKSGKLVLLLDGFDEVIDEQASAIVQELETLSLRMPALRMIVTSRPENAVERSPHFRVFDLAPLGSNEYANVVARITQDPTLAEEIVSGVSKANESIGRLLTTPLMVSLLVVHFRVGQGIPENRVAFYEPLFMLLLQRHDAAKAGYRRRRASKLTDSQLLTFFNCLCFITRRDGVSVLRESKLNAAAASALKWLNVEGPPDTVVADIRGITCLLLKDGLDEYRFLHKSVQEFHAACFVRDQTDALASDFYASMQRRWSEWEQELQFLQTIHRERYDRYFSVPMLDQVVSTLVGASPQDLGRALIGRLTARVMLRPRPQFQNIVYPRDPVGWCLMNFFDGSSIHEGLAEASVRLVGDGNAEPNSATDYRDVSVHEVLARLAPRYAPALDVEAETLGRRITGALEDRKQRMHTLDERRGLFDI
jgi:PII-like signaling protein